MHRMAAVARLETSADMIEHDVDDFTQTGDAYAVRRDLPDGVEMVQLRGPFFFGASGLLLDALERYGATPKVVIVRLRRVPLIDVTGAAALECFVVACRRRGTRVILSGVQPGPRAVLERLGFDGKEVRFAADFQAALAQAREFLPQMG